MVLWYMLMLAVTLAGFSIFLYHNFGQDLHEDVDDLLRSKADGVANAIDTYWETEKLEAEREGATEEVFNKINNINFTKIVKHCIEEKSSDPKLINVVIEIFDVNGTRIASSRHISNVIIFSKNMFDSALKGNDCFGNFNLEIAPKGSLSLRAFALPVIENSRVAYVVQVATPVNSVYSALSILKLLLFFLLPLTVVVTGIGGAFLARLTLEPVDSIIKTIHQITAENMQLRIKLPDTKDEIRRLAETFNDMLERLDNAFTSHRQFMQDVSHELKTPLTILKGELEVTLKRIRSQEEYESVLMSSLDEINKISRIIENLLVLSRFDNREIALNIKPLNLTNLIQSIISDIKVLADQKNIQIGFIPGAATVLKADENQIRRLVLNILDNAIKYTPDKGRIDVAIVSGPDKLKIVITDNGIGIPEADLSRIFDRFYRVDKSRSSLGFGLGLSIAKSIAQVHKGTIEASSKLGQGTTFTITLPAAV